MAQDRKSTRILVVEDETIIAMNICNSLQQFGYETEYISTGENAIEKAQNQDYDLILMDIMLGEGIDGIETAKRILEFKKIPIIYLTAYSDQVTLQKAQVTDPFGYIIKPFHARELYITIELALHKFHSEEAMKEFQNQLYESQKMESIGFLSSGIAHEINNPLTGIINFSILGKEKAMEGGYEELSHYFQRIEEEADRISSIIKSLINLAKEDRGHWSFLDIGATIEEVFTFFRQLFIKERIEFKIQKEQNLPMLYCQSQKIKQAILNLTGFCRTSVLLKKIDEEKLIYIQVRINKTENNQSYVEICFSDSGDGIQKFIMNKEKFERDPIYRSLSIAGIGFHLSQSIAKEHGGELIATIEDDKPKIIMRIPIQSKSSLNANFE